MRELLFNHTKRTCSVSKKAAATELNRRAGKSPDPQAAADGAAQSRALHRLNKIKAAPISFLYSLSSKSDRVCGSLA